MVFFPIILGEILFLNWHIKQLFLSQEETFSIFHPEAKACSLMHVGDNSCCDESSISLCGQNHFIVKCIFLELNHPKSSLEGQRILAFDLNDENFCIFLLTSYLTFRMVPCVALEGSNELLTISP